MSVSFRCNFSTRVLSVRNTSIRDSINGVALIWSTSRLVTRLSTRELRERLTAPRIILLRNNISSFNCTDYTTTSRSLPAVGNPRNASSLFRRTVNSRPLEIRLHTFRPRDKTVWLIKIIEINAI